MPRQKGFTITELSFAMTGLSVLMIILITSAMAITAIYNKGLVLKAANQSGRVLGDDFQKNIRQAGQVQVRRDGGVPIALCAGRVSYVWSAQHKDPTKTKQYHYYADAGDPRQVIGLTKISDTSGIVCNPSFTLEGNIIRSDYQTSPQPGQLIGKEMLADNLSMRYATDSSDKILGLSVTQSANNILTTFQYTIGSTNGDDFIDDGTACQGGKEGEFCALNTFTVTAYSRYAR